MPLLLAGLDVCRLGVYLALPLGAGHVGGDEERPQLVLLLERDVCGGEPLGVDEQLHPGRQGAARQLRLPRRLLCRSSAARTCTRVLFTPNSGELTLLLGGGDARRSSGGGSPWCCDATRAI